MTTETNLSITSIAGLTNNPNQTITGTGAVGATVKVLDGTTLLGTAVIGSDGTWSEAVVLSGQGAHSISAQAVSATVLTTLVNFDGADGRYPVAGLVVDPAGALFGTTSLGGQTITSYGGAGTAFVIADVENPTLSTLVSFDVTNGELPYPGLVQDATGNLYGATSAGGAYGKGTLFKISGTNHEMFTTLVNFNGQNGELPYGSLVSDPSGNLYGTTASGGAKNQGTVFRLSGVDHQTLSTLVTFDGGNGRGPFERLHIDSKGNLYGVTAFGGASGLGTVFELSGINHDTFSTLVSFDGINGAAPYTGMVSDTLGNLYGATAIGGANGAGTVFKLSGENHQSISVLVDITGAAGSGMYGDLTIDSNGNLFGSLMSGGAFQQGSIFEINSASPNTMTTLVSFNGANGRSPGSLAIDGQGNLFGATIAGGLYDQGTVFELSRSTDQSSKSIVVDLDTEAPNIAHLGETSSNARSTLAKAGDVITESFTSTDLVTSVLINGHAASVVRGSGNNYSATYTVQADSANGPAVVVITAQDLAGNITTNTVVDTISWETLFSLNDSGADGTSTFGAYTSTSGISGSPVVSTTVKYDSSSRSSVYFNGTSQLDVINDPALNIGTQNIKISFEMKTDGYQNPYSVIINGLNGTNGSDTSIGNDPAYGNVIHYWPGAGLPKIDGTTNINDANWHKVVATQVDGIASLYVDGTLENQQYVGVLNHDTTQLRVGHLLGQWAGNWDNSFKGWIDNLTVSSGSTTSAPSVTIDTISPVITIIGANSNNAHNTLAKAGDTISQSFTSTDTVTSVLINGQAASVVHGLDDNYTATYTVLASDMNGMAGVIITAFDAAGNTTTDSANSTVLVDTIAPTLAITSASGYTYHENQTITGTGEIGNTINIFDGTKIIGTATVGTDGNWTDQIVLSGLGTHSISATATDSAGNLNTTPITSYVFSAPPTITSQGGLTNQANQVITGTGLSGTTITVFDGAAIVGTTIVASDGIWNDAITLVGQGEHSLSVRTGGAPVLTTLVNFDFNNGWSPNGLISDGLGNLYGTTSYGGLYNDGTIFKLSGADHQTLTTLVNFDGSNGRAPFGSLISDSLGNLYGTTTEGGIHNGGTVFELSGTNYQTLTTLANFDMSYGSLSSSPFSGLTIDQAGNLYGTTTWGGADIAKHAGTVFELSGNDHQTLTTLLNFDGSNGRLPFGNLLCDDQGNLYGTTAGKTSSGYGTVFKLSGASHQTLTTLVNFDGTNGSTPFGGLLIDGTGNLYGTTTTGGLYHGGTVFELSGPNQQVFTTLVNFGVNADGVSTTPFSTLISDKTGNLYGTTTSGGLNNAGTVFELSGTNHQTLTVLANFDYGTGRVPAGNLLSDGAGNLYGSTQANGLGGYGTIFQLNFMKDQSSSNSIVYTIDTVAPLITQLSETSNNSRNTLAKVGDIIIDSFTSTDTVTSVLINGHVASVVHGAGNNYTATYSVQDNAINGLTEVIITAQDLASNTSSIKSIGNVTVDTVAPTVAILSTGGVTKLSTQTIKGIGEAGTTVTLLDGTSTLGSAMVNVDGTWSKLVTLSNQSAHSITALDSDAAGNSSYSAAVLFEVETSSNHAPTVTAPLTSTSAVRTQAFWSNLLSGASDVDTGDLLSVTGLTYTVNGNAASAQAPSGIQLVNNQLLVDPNNTAFNNLTTGQSETIVASYNIADDHGGAVAQTNTIVIGGPAIDPMILNNHAPTVAAPLATTFSKGSQAFWSNLLSGAADVDARNTLNVTDLRFSVAGAAITAVAPTGIQFANNQLLVDPNSTAFKDLTLGQTETIVASYKISDGYGGAVVQTNSLTVTGLGATSAGSNPNSSPSLISVAAALQSTSTAGTQGFWSNLLAGATNSNPNAHLDVANLRFSVNSGASTVIAPVGIQYANKSIMVDPNNTAFRALAAGQSDTIVASYNIVDSLGSSVAQTDTIIINGQGSQGDSSGGVNTPTPNNHAPQVSAPVTAQASVHTSAFWSNMLAGATDSDVGNQLHVGNVLFSLNGGVAVSSAPKGIQVANDQLLVDPNSTAFNHLGVGQADTIVASYNVIDGHGGSVAQTDTVTISGPAATVANGIITGTANHDILTGTAGKDIIIVGPGADTLTGGKGADVFKYTSLSNSPTSSTAPTTTITDFSTTDGDRVDVTAILNGTSTLNSTIHVNQTGASNTSLSVTVGGVEYYIANVPNQAVSVPDAVANPASGATLATALHGADWTTVVDVASAHGAPSTITAAGTATVINAAANPAGDWTAVVQAGAATVDTAQSQVTFAAAPTANAVSIQTADTTVHEVSNVTAVAWHI